MAEKRVSVRLAAIDGQKTREELQAVGRAGDAALKMISGGAPAASQGLSQVSASAQETVARLEALAVRAQATAQAMRGTVDRTAVQARIDSTTGVDSGVKRNSADIETYGRALDDLRAKYSPLYAVSRQYEQSLEEISKAERLGAITAREASAARENAANILRPMAQGLTDVADRSNRFTHNITNASFQVQDFAVQVASGQSAMVAFIQQAPQLAGAMGFAGPVGLWLAGIGTGIAVLGAALPMMGDFRTASKRLEEDLKALDDVFARIEERSRTLQDNSLGETFGTAAGSVREMTERLLELDRASELKQLRSTMTQLLDQNIKPGFLQQAREVLTASRGAPARNEEQLAEANFTEMTGGKGMSYQDFGVRREMIETLAKAGEVEKVVAEISRLIADLANGGPVTEMNAELATTLSSLGDWAVKVAQTEAAFNGTAKAARDAAEAQKELERGVEEIARGAEAAIRQAEASQESAEGVLASLEREAELRRAAAQYGEESVEYVQAKAAAERDAFVEATNSRDVTEELKQQLIDAYDAAKSLSEVDMVSGLNATAQAAWGIAQNLGIAYDKAWAIANMQSQGVMSLDDERGSQRETRQEAGDYLRTKWMEDFRERSKPPKKKRGGGGDKQDEWERAVEKVKQQTAEYNAEAEALSKVEGGTYDYAASVDLAVKKQELLSAAMEAGRKVTPQLEAEIAFLADGLIKAEQGADAAREALEGIADRAERGRDALGGMFSDIVTGSASAKDAVASLLAKIAEVQLQNAVIGAAGNGGFFGSLASTVGGLLTPIPNAKGGVYSSPSLSAFSGTIVDTPTLFAFAKGAGLMGEAGPEVILPLEKGADGVMGVKSSGGGRAAVMRAEINISLAGANGDEAIRRLTLQAAQDGVAQAMQGLPTEVHAINSGNEWRR